VPSQPGEPERSISFYTNALDVEHQGIDIVATSSLDIGSDTSVNLALAYAYNTVDVTGQKLINGIQPVNDGLVEDIENNYPEHRWVLTGNFLIGENFNVMARINYFGEHYDERGTIGADVDPSAKIDPIYYVDLEAGWNLNENWRVVLGGSNRTVANYEGGSWYLKGVYRW
jgi:iron complex outermembrane receptor protein